MSANLPESRKSSSAAKRFGKLSVLLIATVLCTGFVLHAIEKSSYGANAVLKPRVNASKSDKDQPAPLAKNRHEAGFGVPPTLSYGSTNFTFTKNVAVSLTPTASNVDAPAPNVYSSPVVLGSGVTFAVNGAALDAAGNMYVCDHDASTGFVIKINADGTSTNIIGSGFLTQSSNPVVDEAGNVFVADQNQVWKIPAGSTPGTYDAPVVFNNTIHSPYGIAIDAAGNIYVTSLSSGEVFKMDYDGTNVQTIGSGFNLPAGVAIDAAGNVYVVALGTNTLYEIPTSGPQVTLASGFSSALAVALDSDGNIYVCDKSVGIFKVPAGGGTAVQVISGLVNNVGVVVDAAYNIFTPLQGSGGVSKFSPAGGYFISPTALPAGLSFNNTTGTITGTPTANTAKQTYIISAFNSAGGVADTIRIKVGPPAATISYTNPNVDTVGVRIDPIAPSSTGVGTLGFAAKEILATGFSAPHGLAADAAGNIYVADKGHNQVKKVPAGGGTAVSIGTGFSAPSGIAVDAAGNIFVADKDNAEVRKMSADGSTITSIGTGFSTPVGVAVDGAGNVYVADAGNGWVYKILASDGSTVTLSGTFDCLTGIAVDKTGQNIYVSDGPAQSVYKVSPGCGCPEDVGLTLNYPTGVALDPEGNLYISDADFGNNTGIIYKGDAKSCNFTTIDTTFVKPRGVAVDPSGNVLVDDASTNKLYQVSPSGGYFLSTVLPKGLKFNDTTGTIKGKPAAVSPATDYTVYAYNARGGVPATVNIEVVLPPTPTLSYNTSNTYLAGTAITPLSPTSHYVASTVAYADAPVVIGSGFGTAKGTAVDKAGNVFVADSLNNAIMMIPAGGGTAVPWGSGFNQPTGVAVDSLGFVYVADFGNGAVKKIAPDGTSVSTIGSGIVAPNSVAVDTAGNVYATDLSTGLAFEIKASDGSTVELNSSFTFDYPTGIAVDGKYIYVSDGYNGGVARFSAGGIPQLIGPFNYPAGVAVDAVGNLYVSDEGDSTIYRIPAHGSSITALSTTGISGPEGLSVDGKGNVYVADVNNGNVAKIAPTGGFYINKALPAGLSFNSKTGSIKGTPTAASAAKDYVVTGYNIVASTSALFNIAVNLPPLPTVSYAGPLVYTLNQTIVPYAPVITGVGAAGFVSDITVAGSGYVFPYGVGVNHAGDVYVTDVLGAKLYKIPTAGPQTVVSSSFVQPIGVAFDSADNIYVADAGTGSGDGVIKKIPKAGGPATQVGPAFNSLAAIAIDKDNNIYAADFGVATGIVYKIDVHGAVSTITTDVNHPSGLAVDAAGTVYISDLLAGVVYKVLKNTTTAVDMGYTFGVAGGIATDASGNLYVVDSSTGEVEKIPAGGGSEIPISGFTFPYGVAIGPNGNLYVTDAGDGTVKQAKPSGGLYISPALPSGLNFDNTLGIISGKPTVTSPATDYTVTAYSYGGSVTATVNVKVVSSNALLKSLTLSPSTKLTKVTGINYADYVAKVLSNVTSLKVIPVTADNTATVTVNGLTVTSGLESAPITLNADTTSIAVTVTASDGTTKKTYKIAVTRFPSSNALLKSIALSPTTPLTKVAGTNYADYTASVLSPASSISVIPVTADNTSKVTVNGVVSTPGVASAPITLHADTTSIAVTITAADGVSRLTYRVVVTRLANANLTSIALSPSTPLTKVVGPDYANYTANVAHSTQSVKVIPITADAPATVTVNGAPATPGVASAPVTLHTDTTTIAVTITTGDGTTKHTYNVLVTRLPSGNALLKSIALSPTTALTKVTGPDYADYTAHVFSPVSSLQVMPVTADNTATVTVNGVTTTSGGPSAPITLNADTTTIATTVTAGDGVSKLTYKILVTRSYNALLTSIALSPTTTLIKETGVDYADYSATVSNSTKSVKVIPVVADNTSTVTVNGVSATSGAQSAPVTLNADTTAIAVTVTGGDGLTTNTYRIVVHRLPSTSPLLKSLALSPTTTLTSVGGPDYGDYTATVYSPANSIKVIPVVVDNTSTVTINGVPATSGVESAPVALNSDTTAIAVTVTAGDGVSKLTYRIVVTRAFNAYLSALSLSPAATLTKVAGTNYADYTTTVPNLPGTVKVIPVTVDNLATVTVNGATATSGVASAPVTLHADTTAIAVTVTGADGITKNTYRIVVTRLPSSNALLKSISLNPTAKLTKVAGPDYTDYTANVPNGTSTIKVIPVTADNGASVTVNGVVATSGAESNPVTLNADTTTVATTVTAADGVTKKSYVVLITRLPFGSHVLAYNQPQESPILGNEIVIHQNVSPNGDGKSDVMLIEGITAYPDNKLQIMNRSGNLVYEAKGYDNATKVFDGHANDGKLQQAGTYFYSLEYKDGNEIKRKTGFIVLKY